MEETKPRPGNPGDRAQVAAEKLRALRERANRALDEHRQRLAQIESELSLRVRQLAEEFESASAGIERHGANGRDEEVVALREQLEEGRAKHDKFVEQLAFARRQLDAIQAQPCVACHDAAQQIADSQAEITRLREQVQAADQQREEDRARHDKFAEQVAAARQAISDLQSKSHEQTAGLQTELEAARAAKIAAEDQIAGLARDMEVLQGEYDVLHDRAGQLEHQRTASLDEQRRAADAEIAAQGEQLASLKDELETVQRAHDALEKRTDKLQGRLADAENDRDVFRRQKEDAERDKSCVDAELAALKSTTVDAEKSTSQQAAAAEAKYAALEERLIAAEGESSTLTAALSDAASENSKLSRELSDAIAEHSKLSEELSAATASRSELEKSLEAAKRQITALEEVGGELATLKSAKERAESEASSHESAYNELKIAHEKLERELAAVRESTRPLADLEDLQHKFDLALADVQKLKHENGDLREELAGRPEANDQESPELVAIRTERDALAARVDELEQAATAADSTSDQDADDLNRRFQMAVDDVRQLKQENAQLREQLAKAPPSGGGGAHVGSNDWAAQRARLVAMLEQEDGDGPLDAARKKERASIQSTIETTDRILAEKEREIAQLQSARQSQDRSDRADDTARDAEQCLNADELIAAERGRLATLQAELEGKLRAAELELSVERAKLAREQSALKERLFDLQKIESQAGPAAEPVDHKQPRRRWLSALGLGEEGEEPPKPK
jgi:chromosome segregation ATPase